MRGWGTVALACAVHLVAASSASPARAADPVVEARADYDAAAAAYDRADYATAAIRFARADERVPNPRALRLAMAAALLASDAGLAMNLVERSDERARGKAHDPAVTELTRKLRRRFEPAAGRIRVSCPVGAECRPSVDGDSVDAARARWFTAGQHVVTLETGAGAAPMTRKVMVRAGETLEVAFAGPSAESTATVVVPRLVPPATTRDDARTPAPGRTGLSPAVFWAGIAATGIAAGTSTILTTVVANRHDDFVARPSAETAEAGTAAQTRARVAWTVTGAFAITTVVLAVLTDFGGRGGERARSRGPGPRCALRVGPLAASVAGTFW